VELTRFRKRRLLGVAVRCVKRRVMQGRWPDRTQRPVWGSLPIPDRSVPASTAAPRRGDPDSGWPCYRPEAAGATVPAVKFACRANRWGRKAEPCCIVKGRRPPTQPAPASARQACSPWPRMPSQDELRESALPGYGAKAQRSFSQTRRIKPIPER